MAPTLRPVVGETAVFTEQEDRQAYITRHHALKQQVRRLKQELYDLVKQTGVQLAVDNTPHFGSSFKSSFREETARLHSALTKARTGIRRRREHQRQQKHQEEGQVQRFGVSGVAHARVGSARRAWGKSENDTEGLSEIHEEMASLQELLHTCRLTQNRECKNLREKENLLRKNVKEAIKAVDTLDKKVGGGGRPPATRHGKQERKQDKRQEGKSERKSACDPIARSKGQFGYLGGIVRETSTEFLQAQAAMNKLEDEILRDGGLTGGWLAGEHARFLTLWEESGQGGGREEGSTGHEREDPVADMQRTMSFLERAVRVLWQRSEGEIMRHLLWYKEHRLRMKKRSMWVQRLEEAVAGPGAAKKEEAAVRLQRSIRAWRQAKEAQIRADMEKKRREASAKQKRERGAWLRRSARLKEHLTRQRDAREKRERLISLARREADTVAQEERTFKKVVEGSKGVKNYMSSNDPKLVKLILARRAVLSLRHAEKRRHQIWAQRPSRQAEARTRLQKAALRNVYWEQAIFGCGEDITSGRDEKGGGAEGGQARSLPRYVYRDVARLNQATEAWKRQAYDDAELDAKDKARLFCTAHQRPLPPGF